MTNATQLEEKQETMASKLAKEVVNEVNMTSFDRSQREKNVMIFNLKETEVDDQVSIKKLFQHVGVKEETSMKFFRIGKKTTEDSVTEEVTKSKDADVEGAEVQEGTKKNEKIRPIKLVFKGVAEKRKFLSLLYKLESASEELKCISVQHDLSVSERDQLKILLAKAKELNKQRTSKEFVYKVRGPPFAFKIVKLAGPKN